MRKGRQIRISAPRMWTKADRRPTFDRNDQLGDNGEHLRARIDEHIFDALLRQESVRLFDFSKTVEENGEIMVEVELSHQIQNRRQSTNASCERARCSTYLRDIDLPSHHISNPAMINLDGQISSFVESMVFARRVSFVCKQQGKMHTPRAFLTSGTMCQEGLIAP